VDDSRVLSGVIHVIQTGLRWREVLLSLKSWGRIAPELATGDGAMGFWAALDEVYPETRQQRCCQRKIKNVLICLPKLTQPKAWAALHDIWQAETKDDAQKAFDLFIKIYEAKYPQGGTVPTKRPRGAGGILKFPRPAPPSIGKSSAPAIQLNQPLPRSATPPNDRKAASHEMACCICCSSCGTALSKTGERYAALIGFVKVIIGVTFKDGIETTENSRIAASPTILKHQI
jgi:hypothetical protein